MNFFDLNLFFGIEDLAIVVVNVHSCVLDKHGDLFWRHILNKPNFNLTWFSFHSFSLLSRGGKQRQQYATRMHCTAAQMMAPVDTYH